MKRRVRRLFRWAVWVLSGALVAALAISLFALNTELGARVGLRMLAARLPLPVEFNDVRGSLRGPLTLTGLSGATTAMEFQVEQLMFDWRPLQLIRRRVHLDSVRLTGVRAKLMRDTAEAGTTPAPADTPQVATSEAQGLELPVALVFEEIRLEDGVLTASDGINLSDIQLTASGAHDDYQVDATATLAADGLGQAEIESSGRGSLREFRLEDLRAVVLDGEVRGSGAFSWQPRIEWQATLEADGLAPSTLAPRPEDWPGHVSLRAAIAGNLADGRLQMDAEIDTLFGVVRGQPVTGVIVAAVRELEYSLERVDIDWGPVRIDVAGVINSDRLDLDFDVHAPDLSAVLPRSGGSLSASGRLAGSPAAPIVNATAKASAVVLDQITLREADARVDVDWQNRGKSEVDVRIENLEYSNQTVDSARLVITGLREAHEVEAAVASREADILLIASGGITDWTWSGVLGDLGIVTRSAGEWRLDRPASLTASKSAVTLDELCLFASEGDLCIGGTWESQAEWQGHSSINELPFSLLRPLLPEALTIGGTVSGEVSAAGSAGTPRSVELDLQPGTGFLEYVFSDTVAALAYREAHLSVSADDDSLHGSLSVELAESDRTDFGSLSAELSLSSLAELIDRVSTDSFVAALADEWKLKASLDRVSFSLLRPLLPEAVTVDGTVSGRVSTAGQAGVPEYLELELRPSSGSVEYAFRDVADVVRYREAHATVRADGDSVRGSLRLQLADGSAGNFGDVSAEVELPSLADLVDEITADGVVAALQDDWTLSSSIDQIPLAMFNVFLPTGATLAGSLNGTLETSAGPDGTITGQLELEPQRVTSQRSFGAAVHTIRVIDAQVTAHAGPGGVRGDATFSLARPDSPLQGEFAASITLPELTRLDQPLQSQPLEARVEGGLDLTLLDELSDDFTASAGRLDVDLTVGNTISAIEVAGHYQLRGQTDVIPLGIDLRDIDIRASDRPDGVLQIEGSVSSGQGRLTIEGTSPAIPTRESPARLTIRGENFQALRTEQISLVVTPDIDVLIGGRAVEVNGEITVPRAMIEVLEVPQTAVRPSEDVIYVGGTGQVPVEPLDVTAEVMVVLGQEVVFRGFGFNTHLDGTVVAIDRPGRVTQGRGELVLREGIYRGYGQNLAVEPGRLIFAGPIDDPAVDVRAYRRASDGTRAGFLVGGTLKSLDVEIWSDPAKTDSDALSYILFGRSISQGTEADQVQAGSAAAVLGGNMLAMSMASRIGLDDARLETGARQQETAFYAGKYLSPKLYVAYGVGLYEPINVLRVRYLVSRKFTLQAETGTRDSGDILYRIEF
ncbi:MAG: translocation/assembly module TamB domain-containing protein [Gemmatimonadota bacterium]|nr:MAG: translocation/assembly module TamB domain-containing protein [Gemmatimonadota bacterium]